MAEGLSIRRLATADLTSAIRKALYRLCDSAYGSPTESVFEELGRGIHLLAFVAALGRSDGMNGGNGGVSLYARDTASFVRVVDKTGHTHVIKP